MHTRREFLQNLAMIASATGIQGGLLSAIQRAVAIEPDSGSSFLDAEHVVILMQENRSFDHAFGSLRGVRGFHDPRAMTLPDGNPVWVQTNPAKQRFVPFRLDLNQTRSTWMGSLPHGWTDQVDAANKGFHDRWLEVKKSGDRAYAEMPLTLGYYTREDLPFYYALADAFTICDQHFCSTLTGTTPNRLHLWTGTSRRSQSVDAQAVVRNEDCQFGQWADWTTFPERLEDCGVSWKIYQNELTVPTGLHWDTASWLGNYGDSPLEWFTQYHVRCYEKHREHLRHSLKSVEGEIAAISRQLQADAGEATSKLQEKRGTLEATASRLKKELEEFSEEKFQSLSQREKNLHARAFVTNASDPFYREMEELKYDDNGVARQLNIPKGDVLHQFRQDVQKGQLPAVSWIVPAGRFSDHPSYAWFGQWYLSEVLNILTANPEVWKKTIFILTYDENDGYFDHVPPFQAPHPERPETGKTSPGIPTGLDYLEAGQDRKFKPKAALRENSLGLGFRVPMIVASPWSRGGAVCSQVFDHTSVVQFLERFASHKSGCDVHESNITPWRRTICGDLTSVFRSAADVEPGLNDFLSRDPFLQKIHSAQFKDLPQGFHPLTDAEVQEIRQADHSPLLPQQESGTKPACPLPYELEANGGLNRTTGEFEIQLKSGNQRFGQRAAGGAFIAYAWTRSGMTVRHETVAAGAALRDGWPLTDFHDGHYLVRLHGPNGFFREFQGGADDPTAEFRLLDNTAPSGRALTEHPAVRLEIDHVSGSSPISVSIQDRSYGNAPLRMTVPAGKLESVTLSLQASSGWYDLLVTCDESPRLQKHFAGRVETGQWGTTDPAMA